MPARTLQRRLSAALRIDRLHKMSNLRLGYYFNAVGLGGSRLARRVGKLDRKLGRLTFGQHALGYEYRRKD